MSIGLSSTQSFGKGNNMYPKVTLNGFTVQGNPAIYNLRCENLVKPLGIDTTTPRFSWKISSDRNGTRQTAYRILMATDSLLLIDGKADLWDSGKVKSSASVMVPYRGKTLHARTLAYWKVGVWDEKSRQPVWSDISSFSVGLLAPSDRVGSYIGLPRETGNPECPLLRKQFEISVPSEKTYLYVNSLGYHEIYLNGAKVGIDVLSPAVSQFDKRSQVVTYDVSPYIRQGRNDLVIWLGRGWYQPGLPGVVYEGPLVKAQLEVLKDGKWNTLFASDATWSCRESGYTGIGNWRAFHFGGERVDAGKVPDDLTAGTLDAVSWNIVKEIEVPPHAVSPRMTEPDRIREVIKPVRISSLGKDNWLVDMGKVLTGWVEIKFPELKAGQEIEMEYFDYLENGQPGRVVNKTDLERSDFYLSSGKSGVFKNKFNYHGFRYILISNLPSEPSLDDIRAYLIHTDFKEASAFQCSDTDMNAIHDMVHYTLRCVSLGGCLVDCPHLERLGYGDGNAVASTAQTLFDMAPLYANWMQAWADCIREDGGLPHTAPSPYWAGGGPHWCGVIINHPWNVYIHYDDSRLIEKYYPVMQHWLEGDVEKNMVNGLLQKWPDTNYRTWYLGEWAVPEGVDQYAASSVDLVNNCFISICYATMEKIAAVLGKTDDAATYAAKKEQIRKVIHERFFDSARNSYASGSQIDLLYPMLAQVTPEALIPAVTKTLFATTEQNGGRLGVGILGIQILTEWATLNHSTDWVYGMLKKRDYPGYLYMLDNGATGTWEHWNGARSRIHNCFNGIGEWFYRAIGGIRRDDNFPGYRRVIIAPQVPAGVSWAKVSKETPYGTLVVDWEVKYEALHISLTLPPGCTAVLELPENVRNYTLDGKQYTSAQTASNEIPSGKHAIVYSLTGM